MIRYHGEPYEGSDDEANDMMRSRHRERHQSEEKRRAELRDKRERKARERALLDAKERETFERLKAKFEPDT